MTRKNAAGINCICGLEDSKTADDSFVQCTQCNNWMHLSCLKLLEIPVDFVCTFCIKKSKRDIKRKSSTSGVNTRNNVNGDLVVDEDSDTRKISTRISTRKRSRENNSSDDNFNSKAKIARVQSNSESDNDEDEDNVEEDDEVPDEEDIMFSDESNAVLEVQRNDVEAQDYDDTSESNTWDSIHEQYIKLKDKLKSVSWVDSILNLIENEDDSLFSLSYCSDQCSWVLNENEESSGAKNKEDIPEAWKKILVAKKKLESALDLWKDEYQMYLFRENPQHQEYSGR